MNTDPVTAPAPALSTLAARWRHRAALMIGRARANKVDRAYVDGYTDALGDCAAWLELALNRERHR